MCGRCKGGDGDKSGGNATSGADNHQVFHGTPPLHNLFIHAPPFWGARQPTLPVGFFWWNCRRNFKLGQMVSEEINELGRKRIMFIAEQTMVLCHLDLCAQAMNSGLPLPGTSS
jgi:hypothetical protein